MFIFLYSPGTDLFIIKIKLNLPGTKYTDNFIFKFAHVI